MTKRMLVSCPKGISMSIQHGTAELKAVQSCVSWIVGVSGYSSSAIFLECSSAGPDRTVSGSLLWKVQDLFVI